MALTQPAAPDPTPPWVRLSLPPTPAGIAVMADHCGWDVRPVGVNTWDIRQKSDYGGTPVELLTFRKEVPASDAANAPRYAFLATGPPQDQYDPSGDLGRRALDEVGRLLAGTRVNQWQAFTLSVVGAPDAVVADQVREIFTRVARELPGGSLWSGSYHPWLQPRLQIARTLFGLQHTPGRLNLMAPEGITRAGGALGAVTGFALGQYLEALFLAQAPWLPAISSSRAGGAAVLVFGNLQAGREEGPAELIDLYQPQLLSGFLRRKSMPDFDVTDFERALPWGGSQISRLVTVAFDPAAFRAAAGGHDSAAQFATVLSVDRLFAVVNALLVASRREEFLRKTLLFEALDIIEGLTSGRRNHEQTLSFRHCGATLARLERRLPEPVQRLVLPRCRAAVNALHEMVGGFFDTDRHEGTQLVLALNTGERRLTWDRAVVTYLRSVIRNGAHSYRDRMRQEPDRQLFASHTGELPAELSDLAYLHLLDLFTKPEQMVPAYWVTRPASLEPDPTPDECLQAVSRPAR